VVPSEEFVRLDGGDMSRGDKGGVICAFTSVDHIVCPGNEPKLPVVLPALDVTAGTGIEPLGTTLRGQEWDVPSNLQGQKCKKLLIVL